MILEWQWNDLTRCLDILECLQSALYDASLHLNVVWLTSVSSHWYQWSNGTWSTCLSYYWWKCCDDYCRDSDLLNCSLHDCCRAVASSSSSGHENTVYVF